MKTIIFGPPGTGKTTTLLNIVDETLKSGIPPERIAFVSFTNKAADEARDRALDRFPQYQKDQFMYFRTIHSMAFREMGFKRSEVMGANNWAELSALTRMDFSGSYNIELRNNFASLEGDKVLFAMGLARSKMEPLETAGKYARTVPRLKFNHAVETILEYKRGLGLVDFTDMLERALDCRPLDIDVAIIDEAQDLSRLQWRLVERLLANAKKTYIAGDDDQAIYRWAGADVNYFQQIEGERRVLERSYRLPRSSFEYAANVIRGVSNRVPKEWSHNGTEGECNVVSQVTRVPLSNDPWLILARGKRSLSALSGTLRADGIPHTGAGGYETINEDHVLAIDAWKAVQEGQHIDDYQAIVLYKFLDSAMEGRAIDYKFEPEIVYDYNLLREKFGLLAAKETPWYDVLERIRLTDRTYYRRVGKRFGKLTHDMQHRIQLSTIHTTKGGECENVLLLAEVPKMVRDTLQGNDQDKREDERRVYYVGATRAKNRLFILRTKSPNKYPIYET